MKSIKPGRGPSMMNAFGSAAAAIFGVIWVISAMSMGAPFFFPLFGVVFIAMGIGQAVYNYKNATGENRFSEYDITDGTEERDPFNDYFGRNSQGERSQSESAPIVEEGRRFCPYCGSKAEDEFVYCAKCGRKLP